VEDIIPASAEEDSKVKLLKSKGKAPQQY